MDYYGRTQFNNINYDEENINIFIQTHGTNCIENIAFSEIDPFILLCMYQ